MTAQYFALVANGKVTGSGYTPDGTLPVGALVCSQEQAEAAGPWSTIANGVLAVGTAPTMGLGPSAQAALDRSDITVLRCFEHAVTVPPDWVTYRAALRTIIAGGSATALPAVPAYPPGT
jgi:hypothetical protein